MNLGSLPSVVISVGLIALTVTAFWRVQDCDFVVVDDPDYVTKNSMVKGGLNWQGVGRAFTTFEASNWHPLTWLSLMADCQLFGLDAAAFHRTNLGLHVANVLVLFVALVRMTSALWRCALVAALFAIHPLHVESVAWVTERKDVLSTLFWMLSLIVYPVYVTRPNWKSYLLLMVLLTLGLMSKQMLVTLPFVLLLLDVWPLGRIQIPGFRRTPSATDSSLNSSAGASLEMTASSRPTSLQTTWRSAILEKVPLLILSAGACCMTLLAQRAAIRDTGAFLKISATERFANALVSYGRYLRQAVWPVGLCCYYPYAEHRTSTVTLIAVALLLLGLTFIAVYTVKSNPAILVGWLWYLGTLVPVIGLVQVGGQSIADRYTYVPLIGIFIVLAWSLPGTSKHSGLRLLTGTLICAIVLILVVFCRRQVETWRTTQTLFRQANAVTPEYWRSSFFIAQDLHQKGQLGEAAKYYRHSAKLAPRNEAVQAECGNRLAQIGSYRDAANCFEKAIDLAPQISEYHHHLGLMLVRMRDVAAGADQFQIAIQLAPDDAGTHSDLGAALMELGQRDRAEEEFRAALRLNPDDLLAKRNLQILSEPNHEKSDDQD